VTTCVADAEGAYSYSVGNGEPCVRLIFELLHSLIQVPELTGQLKQFHIYLFILSMSCAI
jgi:hypothetical protein